MKKNEIRYYVIGFGTDYYPKTDADPYMVWDEQAGKWRMYERIHP